MADPTKYTPGYDFSNYQANQPNKPLPGDRVDVELADIAASIDETVEALKDIRRSDGGLQNGIVVLDSLEPGLGADLEGWATTASQAALAAQTAWATSSFQGFATRAAFAAANAATPGLGLENGQAIWAEGLAYVRQTGATALPGLPGFSPAGDTTPMHFGAAGDGVTNDTAAFAAMSQYLLANPGGRVVMAGRAFSIGQWEYADRTTYVGGTLIAATGQAQANFWIANLNRRSSEAGRGARDVTFQDVTFDGTNLPFTRWLTNSSGAPITNPAADYVAGTGALASGISGVSLTAAVTSGAVSGVTVVTGGAGWNGHPTHPYLPDTVALRFTGGGGRGAKGFATISGGTLTSATVTDGGTGYTSPPTVTTMGGFADIALLVEPSVNRRNAAHQVGQHGAGVIAQKIDRAQFVRCRFIRIKRIALADLGCKNFTASQCEFVECGKNDGAFPCIFQNSFGDPALPTTSFADSEGGLIEDCTFESPERSAILFSPTKGGTILRPRIFNSGESAIFCSERLNFNGGRSLIEGGEIHGGQVTDIVSMAIEALQVSRLSVRKVTIRGSALAMNFSGGVDKEFFRNSVENCVTGLTLTNDFRIPFGPFSERFAFNTGRRPECGEEINVKSTSVIQIGAGTGGSRSLRIAQNVFSDTRADAEKPGFFFQQYRAGAANQGGDTVIEDNDFVAAPGIQFLDALIGNVWQTAIPLHVRRNTGHVSETAVTVSVSHLAGTTGVQSVNVGFRPSRVSIYAAGSDPAQARGWIGEVFWSPDGSRQDGGLAVNTENSVSVLASEFARLVDGAGATVWGAEFVAWTVTGFTYNIVTATANCNLRLVCYP